MATQEELRAELEESVKQLAGDVRFKVFVKSIEGLHKYAIANACSDAALANPGTTAAALGECRAYQDILGLVDEYREKSGLDS